MRQIHIFYRKIANLILEKVYLVNAFINLKSKPGIFYKTDLFLKY